MCENCLMVSSCLPVRTHRKTGCVFALSCSESVVKCVFALSYSESVVKRVCYISHRKKFSQNSFRSFVVKHVAASDLRSERTTTGNLNHRRYRNSGPMQKQTRNAVKCVV
jgi:hypothetical protein